MENVETNASKPESSDKNSLRDEANLDKNSSRERWSHLKTGAWFFVFYTIFLGLISLNYFRQVEIDFSGEGWIYALLTMFGHFAMLCAAAWLVLCVPVALIHTPPRPRRKILGAALCVVAGTLGAILVVSDTFVFGLYRFHVYNGFVLELLLGDGAAGIFTFTAGQVALMIFGVLAVVVATLGLWFAARFFARKRSGKFLGVCAGTLFAMLVASHLMHAYFSASGSRSVYRIAEVYPAYFPLTANRFLIKHGFVDAEKVREKIKVNAGSALAYPRNPIVFSKKADKNFLVIFIDSWNAKTFAPDVMPNAWNFAKNAQVFSDHWSGDHGTRTGVISFFHGLPGLYYNTIRDGGVSSVFVDALLSQNYEMEILATASLSNPPFTRTIFKNVPAEKISDNLYKTGSTADGDLRLAEKWLEWTKNYTSVPAEKRRPFFGFLFFDELHSMILPRDAEIKFPTDWQAPKYEILSKNTDPAPFFNLYKNEAFWLDKLLGKIFGDLRERGLLENTIVILTGDHGQEFNENKNNLWGHGSAFSSPQLKVPFVLFDATLPPKNHAHWTSHYDATVTLLKNYLHAENTPSDFSVGKNLFDETPREWLLVGHPEQFGVIEKTRITHVKHDRSYEIFDRNLNDLPDAKLNVPVFRAALEQAGEFYKSER